MPEVKKPTARVMADIDQNLFDYLFGKVFVGTRGIRQQLISTFLEKLRDACVAAGIPAQWEPENEAMVDEIMSKLNFNPQKPHVKRKRKPAGTSESPRDKQEPAA